MRPFPTLFKNSVRFSVAMLMLVTSSIALISAHGEPQQGPNPSSKTKQQFDYLVRDDMFAGFQGDSVRMQRAMKLCEDTLAVNPRHPEALVWHGSGLWFQSGTAYRAGDMQRGQELSTRGMDEMDSAVALAPTNLAVLIPRGTFLLQASKYVPDPYGKPLIEKGLGDMAVVYKLQKKYYSKLPTHLKGELLGSLADGWNRLGQQEKARPYFVRLSKELKGTPYAEQANEWLSGKNKTVSPTCLGCHQD